MKKTLASLLLGWGVLFLGGCGGGGSGGSSLPTLSSIEVSAPKTSITAGETIELSAVGIQSDGSRRTASVDWTVSDTSLASLVSNRLQGKKAGEVEVVATEVFGKIQGKLKITITPSQPTGINIQGFQDSKTQYSTNDTRQLNVVAIHPENSKTPITTPVTWTSSNPNIATVDNTGRFTAQTAGPVTISAQWQGFTKQVALEIKQAQTNPIVVTCSTPPSITRSQWNAWRAADPQNGSEWLRFDPNSCTQEFIGIYVRDDTTANSSSTSYYSLIKATLKEGRYQTSVTTKDLTATDTRMVVGYESYSGSLFFSVFSNTALDLQP